MLPFLTRGLLPCLDWKKLLPRYFSNSQAMNFFKSSMLGVWYLSLQSQMNFFTRLLTVSRIKLSFEFSVLKRTKNSDLEISLLGLLNTRWYMASINLSVNAHSKNKCDTVSGLSSGTLFKEQKVQFLSCPLTKLATLVFVPI